MITFILLITVVFVLVVSGFAICNSVFRDRVYGLGMARDCPLSDLGFWRVYVI